MARLAGSFLVARPVLQDPNFVQTVVLLLRHGSDGAFGLVVNRPAMAEGAPFPVFEGGPCPGPGLIMLHGHIDWVEPSEVEAEQPTEIIPGLYLGNADCFAKASDLPEGETPRVRLYSGYSGWGSDQLERELTSGAWIVAPATADLLFDTPSEELWDRLSPPATPKPSMN